MHVKTDQDQFELLPKYWQAKPLFYSVKLFYVTDTMRTWTDTRNEKASFLLLTLLALTGLKAQSPLA